MSKKSTKKTAKKAAKKTTKKATKKTAKKVMKKSSATQMSDSGDLVDLLLRDHKPLKRLIKTMKSENADVDEKRAAFEEFAPALIAHAKAEEQTFYRNMQSEEDMNVEALEGFTEHALADSLVEAIDGEDDDDTFEAKVKVLAEMVEHHIEEEEDDMFPAYRHRSTKEQRAELGMEYEELHRQFTAGEIPGRVLSGESAESFAQTH